MCKNWFRRPHANNQHNTGSGWMLSEQYSPVPASLLGTCLWTAGGLSFHVCEMGVALPMSWVSL